jgi:LmbE family N-acetylglucosaminyl deacetylase
VKIAVISPHRGDAAFALGLAIGAWIDQGHSVEVVNCFTRTEHAPFSDVASLHPNDRMSFASATRKREDEAWAKLYPAGKNAMGQTRGRLTLIDLNLKDAPLRLHIAPEEVYSVAMNPPGVNPSEKALLKIRGALERFLGARGAGAVVAPLAVGGHVDHRTAREAALTGAMVPMAFYEDLPGAALAEAEAVMECVDAASLALGVGLAEAYAEGALEGAVARKRRMALCYDSQIDDATVERIAGLCERYGGRERLWGNAAWRAVFA